MTDRPIALLSYPAPVQIDAIALRQIKYLSKVRSVVFIGCGTPPPELRVRSIQVMEENSQAGTPMLTLKERIAGRVRRGALLSPPSRLAQLWEDAFATIALRIAPQAASERIFRRSPVARRAEQALLELNPAVIHANEPNTLPVAMTAARRTASRVVLFLKEWAPGNSRDLYWRLARRPLIEETLRRYGPLVDATIATVPSWARLYQEHFGFSPLVVMNAPEFVELPEPREVTTPIRLVFQGFVRPGVEVAIRAFQWLEPRFELHLLLLADDAQRRGLEDLARRFGRGRVFFHKPVAPGEVARRLTDYDMGVWVQPMKGPQDAGQLPNKLFEWIAAGLAVCISDGPDRRRLVEEWRCGILLEHGKPRALAEALNRLEPGRVQEYKSASRRARHQLNAATEMGRLVKLYEELLA